jgi:membrane-associated HD superfamily phosphohydrolase
MPRRSPRKKSRRSRQQRSSRRHSPRYRASVEAELTHREELEALTKQIEELKNELQENELQENELQIAESPLAHKKTPHTVADVSMLQNKLRSLETINEQRREKLRLLQTLNDQRQEKLSQMAETIELFKRRYFRPISPS